jgi:hypothetical protein
MEFVYMSDTSCTYPPQRDEAVDVTLDHFYTLVAGVSPVAVHYERDVVRDGARFEYAKEDTSDAIDCIVAKPECVLQKRHHWGGQLIGAAPSFYS